MGTLASATLDIARLINNVVEGTATGGSTTTLIDTGFPYRPNLSAPPDDFYNQGTIWFLSGTSIIGTTAIITDWAQSTTTFTFATLAATASGARYAVCDRTYPRYVLRQAVNSVLAEIGGEDAENTSLTTVADQMTYDLPNGVYNVIRVEIATSLSAPYGYVEIPTNKWREMNDDIVFEDFYQPTATGYTIRLTYRVPLSELTSDTGAIPDLYNSDWLRWAGAAYCIGWRIGQLRTDDPLLVQELQRAEAKAAQMAARHAPGLRRIERSPATSVWDVSGITSNDPPPGTARLK